VTLPVALFLSPRRLLPLEQDTCHAFAKPLQRRDSAKAPPLQTRLFEKLRHAPRRRCRPTS